MPGDIAGVIAIVDDEEALREAVGSLVRSAGFEVESFSSAEDFLDSECVGRALCIVLDVRLPGMSGLDLQEYLATIGASVPIVFITAQDDDNGGLRARALDAGARAFLRKPFDVSDLLGAVYG